MPNVHAEAESKRDVDEVAAVIGDFFGMHNWAPFVVATERDPARPAVRIVTTPDGGKAVEELLEAKPGFCRYRILEPAGPMVNFEGVLAVGPNPAAPGSLITWDASFDCEEAMASVLTDAIAGTYKSGLAGLA